MVGGSGAFSRSASPSLPAYFAEPSSLSQMRFSQMEGRARYSPEYADNDLTVDPNVTYSSASAPRGSNAFRFTVDLNNELPESPSAPRTGKQSRPRDRRHWSPQQPVQRRQQERPPYVRQHVRRNLATLEDDDVNDADILSGMIRSGRAYEPVIEDDDYEEEGDDYEEGDEVDGEAVEEDADEQAEEELIDADNGVTTKKKRKKRTGDTRGPKWKSLEDKCLIDAWKHVSFCPITGANQSGGKYYKRIYDQFNERKNFGEYATIHMIRNESAMSHRWNIIKAACNKFHGCYEKVKRCAESGKTMVDWMLDPLDMYKSRNGDKDFLFMHCFKKLEGCKKCNAIRLTLNDKDDVGEDGLDLAAVLKLPVWRTLPQMKKDVPMFPKR